MFEGHLKYRNDVRDTSIDGLLVRIVAVICKRVRLTRNERRSFADLLCKITGEIYTWCS